MNRPIDPTTQTTLRSSVNIRCLEIIKEIASNNQLVTGEFVIQVLLQRYGILEFSNLNVGNIKDIPALSLLIEIQQKVSFMYAYNFSNTVTFFELL